MAADLGNTKAMMEIAQYGYKSMKKNLFPAAEVKDLVPSTANEILTTNIHVIGFMAPKKHFWQTLATGAAIGLVAYAICKDILRKDQK